jgi:hypothetical protein
MGVRSELEAAITSLIAEEKAYNVEAVCVSFGLDPANGDDPNRSKAKYVERRIKALDTAGMLALGERVLPDYSDRAGFEGQHHALRVYWPSVNRTLGLAV